MYNLIRKFNINHEGIDYFVGDLHGCYSKLEEKLQAVGFDKETDRLFCVGDLIDRGPRSIDCLNLLLEPWFFSCVGNHEDLMMGNYGLQIWLSNGGTWSLMESENDIGAYQKLILKKCYLRMEVETEFGKIGVVHAESELNWDDNSGDSVERNLWARSKIQRNDHSRIENIDRIVVGHTPLNDPKMLGNVLYIDTGAVFNGELTMLTPKEIFKYLDTEMAH